MICGHSVASIRRQIEWSMSEIKKCPVCNAGFGWFTHRYWCERCRRPFCSKHCTVDVFTEASIRELKFKPVRVCNPCANEDGAAMASLGIQMVHWYYMCGKKYGRDAGLGVLGNRGKYSVSDRAYEEDIQALDGRDNGEPLNRQAFDLGFSRGREWGKAEAKENKLEMQRLREREERERKG